MRLLAPPKVNDLKAAIANCCRPLLWKMLMSLEVENLAIELHLGGFGAPSQAQVTVEALPGAPAVPGNNGNHDGAGGCLPPPQSSQWAGWRAGCGDTHANLDPGWLLGAACLEMNVLDRIVAMVLARTPALNGDTPAVHTGKLVAWHLALKEQWMRDFGTLPWTAREL
jgi:hypothetical protein